MTQIGTRIGFGIAAAVIAAAAGCGGGGSGSPTFNGNLGSTGSDTGSANGTGTGGTTGTTGTTMASGSEVPTSALQNVGALIAYLQSLVASSADTARPVVLGDIKLPVDDTAASMPLQ